MFTPHSRSWRPHRLIRPYLTRFIPTLQRTFIAQDSAFPDKPNNSQENIVSRVVLSLSLTEGNSRGEFKKKIFISDSFSDCLPRNTWFGQSRRSFIGVCFRETLLVQNNHSDIRIVRESITKGNTLITNAFVSRSTPVFSEHQRKATVFYVRTNLLTVLLLCKPVQSRKYIYSLNDNSDVE